MSFATDKDSKLPTEHNEQFDEDQIADVMRDQVTGEISEAAVRAEGEEKVTWFVWILVLASSISGLLFGKFLRSLFISILSGYLYTLYTGYDTGVISGALVTIGSDLGPAELSNTQKELITSSTTLGALLGGLAAGIVSDFVGRKPVLAGANVSLFQSEESPET